MNTTCYYVLHTVSWRAYVMSNSHAFDIRQAALPEPLRPRGLRCSNAVLLATKKAGAHTTPAPPRLELCDCQHGEAVSIWDACRLCPGQTGGSFEHAHVSLGLTLWPGYPWQRRGGSGSSRLGAQAAATHLSSPLIEMGGAGILLLTLSA
jgi:hypothetical protein